LFLAHRIVPFRHGSVDVVKFSEDSVTSSFEFGVEFLDPNKMTYWGKHRDANFCTENASIDWKDSEAPVHTIGRLTLLPMSHLRADASDAVYFDVTGNSTSDSTPVGSNNRARWPSEVASRRARMQSANKGGQSSDKAEGLGPYVQKNAASEEDAYEGKRI
jgi:hypothetical protein